MAFIYQLESSPTYCPIVEPFFAAVARGYIRAVTSVITLMEIAVLPIRLDRSDLADNYEAYLLAYPNLTILDVDRAIARRASELRASRRLRPADAIQAATALTAGAHSFLTNDRALAQLPGIQTITLDSYVDAPL